MWRWFVGRLTAVGVQVGWLGLFGVVECGVGWFDCDCFAVNSVVFI